MTSRPYITLFNEFEGDPQELFGDLHQSLDVHQSSTPMESKCGSRRNEMMIYRTNVKLFHPKDYPASELEKLINLLESRGLQKNNIHHSDRVIFKYHHHQPPPPHHPPHKEKDDQKIPSPLSFDLGEDP